MAVLPPAPPRSKRVIVVVGLVAVLAVASLVVYLQTGSASRTTSGQTFSGTITTTFTNPCSTTSFASASTAATGVQQPGPYFPSGPLLGNFSAMTVVLDADAPTVNSVTTSSFMVLNRSSTANGGRYEVNITNTQNTTSTIVPPGNYTMRGSLLGVFSQNGSLVSIVSTSGTGSRNDSASSPAFFFPSLFPVQLSRNFSAASSQFHTINTTTVTIGSTEMSVTDYQLPTLDTVVIQEGCGGQQAALGSTTISHQIVQAGRVPGTDFTLVTRYNQFSSVQSSSTGSSGLTFIEEVTDFTVA